MVRACVIAFSAYLGAACTGQIVSAFPESFVGVGVELTMKDHGPAVVRLIDGGPAARAGVETDENVLAIDHIPVNGMALADVVVRLRGREGSPVDLTLMRHGIELSTTIVRSSMQKSTGGYTARSTAQR